ncbi:THAP domain-containing protein 2-like [Styela clava]
MVGCSALNCTGRYEKGKRMFRFPTDLSRRKRWSINCRRDKWFPSKNARLCQDHFEKSQFEGQRLDGNTKLKPNAIPTLFDVPNCPKLLTSQRRVLKRAMLTEAKKISCSGSE